MVGALVQPLRLHDPAGSGSGRRVTWLELFFDLAFVAAVAQVGAPLAHDYTPAGLRRYGFLFLLLWWAWSGDTLFATRFSSDDGVRRLLTLAQIFLVAVMAVNAKDALDSRSSAGFAAAYGAMRLVLVVQYLRARGVPQARPLATAHAIGFGLAAACWLVSATVPAPARFWLWAVALVIDLGTPIATAHLTTRIPPDPEHLPERFGLFTIILLGESLVAVMKGMESHEAWRSRGGKRRLSRRDVGVRVVVVVLSRRVLRQAPGDRVAPPGPPVPRLEFRAPAAVLGIAVCGVGVEHIIRVAGARQLHAEELWMLGGAILVLMAALAVIGASSGGARADDARLAS